MRKSSLLIRRITRRLKVSGGGGTPDAFLDICDMVIITDAGFSRSARVSNTGIIAKFAGDLIDHIAGIASAFHTVQLTILIPTVTFFKIWGSS